MKLKSDPGKYESIQHFTSISAKVNILCVRSSAYHWHYDYELIAVLKGKIEVLYGVYGPEAQKLSAGDIILINPKEMHGIRGIELDNNCLCIQFSPELFEPVPAGMKYYFYLNSYSKEYKTGLPYEHYMRLAAQIGLAHRDNQADANLRKKACLYLLLADLLTGVPYELRSAPDDNEENMKLVKEISSFIDANLMMENLSDNVCKTFGISEKGMYLLLKGIVGLSLKEVIDIARIERACMLLQNADISLEMVSYRCGFSGTATFYRRFKGVMGITPGDYRKGVEANIARDEIQDYLSFDESGVDLLLRYWAEQGGQSH